MGQPCYSFINVTDVHVAHVQVPVEGSDPPGAGVNGSISRCETHDVGAGSQTLQRAASALNGQAIAPALIYLLFWEFFEFNWRKTG